MLFRANIFTGVLSDASALVYRRPFFEFTANATDGGALVPSTRSTTPAQYGWSTQATATLITKNGPVTTERKNANGRCTIAAKGRRHRKATFREDVPLDGLGREDGSHRRRTARKYSNTSCGIKRPLARRPYHQRTTRQKAFRQSHGFLFRDEFAVSVGESAQCA